MSNRISVSGARRRVAWGKLTAAALVATLASCGMGPGTSQEATQTTQAPEGPPLAVLAQALTTPVQGMYVVTAQGTDGYCDAVLFAGNHGAAIQSCIDRANADGGGVVLLRAGTYNSGTWPLTLKSNVTLLGAGNFGAQLWPSAAQIIGTVQDNTKVQGLFFNEGSVTEGAIRLGATAGAHSNLAFEGNKFQLTHGATSGRLNGIYAPAGANSFSGIAVRNNNFVFNPPVSQVTDYGVDLEVTSGQGRLDNIRVESNDFLNLSPGTALPVTLSNATATAPSLQVVASNNTFRIGNGGSLLFSYSYGIVLAGVLDALVTGNSGQVYIGFVRLLAGAATSCGAMIVGNNFGGGASAEVYDCVSNSTVVANTQNAESVGTGKPGVLVRAYKNGGSQNFMAGSHPTLTFDVVEVNYNLSFDAVSGIFTAPVAGVYRMHACARFSSSNFTSADSAQIKLNAAGTVTAVSQGPVLGASTTECVDDIATVQAGDQITCVVDGTGSANQRTVLGTGRYSTFISIERVSD